MSRLASLACLAIAATTLGCKQPLQFFGFTSPPPLAQAELDDDGNGHTSITISKGVAIEFDCYDPNIPDWCKSMSGKMADPSIASVSRGFIGSDGSSTEAALVVVGLEAGETTLVVGADTIQGEISVTVVDF